MLLASVETSMAAEKPLLGDPAAAFTAYFGDSKPIESVLGNTRLWKKSPFIITHVEGKGSVSFDCLSVTKIANTPPLNRREAFLIAERFCGRQQWEFRNVDNGREFYVNADKTFQLAFNPTAVESMNGHVTLTYFPLTTGIKEL